MRSASSILALAATAAAPAIASAQLITPIDQNRQISGTAMAAHTSGVSDVQTPPPDVAPVGDFLQWPLFLNFGALVTGPDTFTASANVSSSMDGGWNGDDVIELGATNFSVSGGGGLGYSGSATVTGTFEYTFTIAQELDYTLVGGFGSSCPQTPLGDLTGELTLTGPGGVIHSFSNPCNGSADFDEAGTLAAGEYTISFVMGGTAEFTGPGGNGGGGGNSSRVFTFQVAVPSCEADLTGDDVVDVFDLLAYLDLWFSADAAADIDGAAGVDVFDLLAYLDGWFAGC